MSYQIPRPFTNLSDLCSNTFLRNALQQSQSCFFIFPFFVCFFSFFLFSSFWKKKMRKFLQDDFFQQMACKASLHWSKYTTPTQMILFSIHRRNTTFLWQVFVRHSYWMFNEPSLFRDQFLFQANCWDWCNPKKLHIAFGVNHRHLIEVDCSSSHFKSAKLKDKEFTINAPSFYTTLQKRKRLMHQFFNICWQMVIC